MQPKPLHRTCTAHVLDMYANENLMVSIVGSTQSFLFSGSDHKPDKNNYISTDISDSTLVSESTVVLSITRYTHAQMPRAECIVNSFISLASQPSSAPIQLPGPLTLFFCLPASGLLNSFSPQS